MKSPIQTIGIIGGGSAGYIAALFLRQALPHLDVTVIESSRHPVIGVGEATTQPMLRSLHGQMGFPVREFVEQARPTLKLGIRFIWGEPGVDHYNSAFGTSDLTSALRTTGEPNDKSLNSLLMETGQVPIAMLQDLVLLPKLDSMAYHIGNRHFLAYLKRKLLALGCRHLDEEIAAVAVSPDGTEIDHLHTSAGQQRRFDLYLDCSGFRSLLLEGGLKAPWVSYASSLKTDRAVLGKRVDTGEIAPYTTARTLRSGWLWNTPMQQEDHLGYVFSSQYCSDEEALAELKLHCDEMQETRVVRFRTGRHEASWVGNVVAVGNAFAFSEPLESTGIHMILKQLRSLTKRLASGSTQPGDVASYNDSTNRGWDGLRWFIALHFRFNHKLNTLFWRDCQTQTDVSGLEEYLEYFEAHGPVSDNPAHPLFNRLNRDNVFRVFAYDAHLAGCGLGGDWFRSASGSRDKIFQARHQVNQSLVKTAMHHRQALQYLQQHDCVFRTT